MNCKDEAGKNTSLTLDARAKINLTLDVTGVREDGYHLVRMLMQSISLHDTVTLTVRETPGISLETDSRAIPADSSNLMWKAAERMFSVCGISPGLDMKLQKRIPAAAGLAGGSTDAAAVMLGINRLFRLGLSREELMRLALPLGADIPYCILGGTALAEGIGEILTPLPEMPACTILLARPEIEVSTGWVYRTLDSTLVLRHPDTGEALQALREGQLSRLAACMENVLEQVTVPAHPVVEEIRRQMLESGALGARMSGSGPTVFGIFSDKAAARTALETVQQAGLAAQAMLAEPVPAEK